MRLVVARCQVDYAGRLTAHLPMATRVLMLKADGSVLVHSDGGSYKPLNWMSPPCTLREGTTDEGQVEWTVTSKTEDTLRILIEEIRFSGSSLVSRLLLGLGRPNLGADFVIARIGRK